MDSKRGPVRSAMASATGEPRCGVPIVTRVLTRSATLGIFVAGAATLSSPSHAMRNHMEFLIRIRHLQDRSRQLFAALRDTSDRIHLRSFDDVAVRFKVCGNAIEIIDKQRHARKTTESKNAVSENDCLFCHF